MLHFRKKNSSNSVEKIYSKAEFYDLIYSGHDGDLEYYLERAGKKRCLYLGIGTGRIFGALANKNPEAYGLDNSDSMLKILFNRFPNIGKDRVFKCSVLDINRKIGKFDTIIAPYAFFNYFSTTEIINIMTKLITCLKPGGKFYTDTFSPFKNPDFQSISEVLSKRTAKGKLQTFVTYDYVHQTLEERTSILIGDKPTELLLQNYYYYPNEFLHIFSHANFRKINIFGGFNKETLTTESEFFVIEAVK